MSVEPSVTFWLIQLQQGDAAAAALLWNRYFDRLVHLARQKLRGRALRASDEEDVALSAFHSFCRGVERGRYPHLQDRDNLWRLLVTITAHKVLHMLRDAGRQKRGGGAEVYGENDLTAEDWGALSNLAGAEPTPEFAAEVAEQCECLLIALDSAELRAIALQKMEGFTNEEIATSKGCAPRTVERKLRIIRGIWEQCGAQN